MKYILLAFFSFFLLNLQGQERVLINGLVKSNDSLLKNVHVKNVSSVKFSVSDEYGNFQLNIKTGDTLLLTHVGMEDLIAYVKEEDLQKIPLQFNMKESSMELKEVMVDETSEINAVSLGIIPKKIEKLSVNERRLRQAGDFKPKHMLGILGGGVSFDAILNAINGRTKKLKRNIDYEAKEKNIVFLEINYAQYMQKEMNLSEHEMKLLINEVIEDNELQKLIAAGNKPRLEFFLIDRWIKFKEELQNSIAE